MLANIKGFSRATANVTALEEKRTDLGFSSIIILLFPSMGSLSGSIVSRLLRVLSLARVGMLSTPSVSRSLLHSGATSRKIHVHETTLRHRCSRRSIYNNELLSRLVRLRTIFSVVGLINYRLSTCVGVSQSTAICDLE